MAAKRNSDGTFKPGSSGNPGGKRKGYLAMLQAVCTEEKWRAICDKAVAQAIHGDKSARKWVSEYLMGLPVQRVKAEVETRSIIYERYADDIARIYGDGTDSPGPEQSADSD